MHIDIQCHIERDFDSIDSSKLLKTDNMNMSITFILMNIKCSQ